MNVDDPRLTAYALGEIQGRKHALLRSEILKSEELQQEVARITDLAGQLGDALQVESASLRLDPEQRLALLTVPRPPKPINPLPAFIPAFGVAIAASIAIALWLTTYATRDPMPSGLGSAAKTGSTEVPTPLMTVSLIPPEHAIEAQPPGSNPPPQPSLPDTALIPRTRSHPAAAPAPRWNLMAQQHHTERHPSTAANLADQFAQFGENHAGTQHEYHAAYGTSQQFTPVSDTPVMGLSVNAVTGGFSLSQLHKTVQQGRYLQPGTVRLEQVLNHFDYARPNPDPADVFALGVELGACPWTEGHILAKIDAAACIVDHREAGQVAHSAGLEVTFNPTLIRSYRLLGFNQQQTLDPNAFLASGEVPPDRTLTVLYELIPTRATTGRSDLHEHSAPGNPVATISTAVQPVMLDADILYRTSATSGLRRTGRASAGLVRTIDECSDDFRFAAAVAAFVLRIDGDEKAGKLTFDTMIELAQSGVGEPPARKRSEFIHLIRTARQSAAP